MIISFTVLSESKTYDVEIDFDEFLELAKEDKYTYFLDTLSSVTPRKIISILIEGIFLTPDNFNELITIDKINRNNRGYIQAVLKPEPAAVASGKLSLELYDMLGGAKKKNQNVVKKGSLKKGSKKMTKKKGSLKKGSLKKGSKKITGGAKKKGSLKKGTKKRSKKMTGGAKKKNSLKKGSKRTKK
jgi:hypothetical protein